MSRSILKRTLLVLAVGAVVYLALWPTPIDPVAWQSPEPRFFPPTGSLTDITRVSIPSGHGPEDIDVDSSGRIYAAMADGRILRWADLSASPTEFANTNGRPLGLHWDLQERLVVADATRGLVRIDDTGAVEVLTSTCGERALGFTDDLEVAADGTIWFSDASVVYPQTNWRADIVESRAHGRLCAYDDETGRTREVVRNLYFANGVAIDPAQQFVLVNETSRYRVRRLWIDGPRRGQFETLIENLPGFPDGISTGTNGRFWLAIASPRSPVIDSTSSLPWLRKAMWRLPQWLQPRPQRTARIMGIDANGRVLHDFFDPDGTKLHVITSVQERGGTLYLGSLVDDAWAYRPVPQDRP